MNDENVSDGSPEEDELSATFAVSPTDRSSDRAQSDADQVVTIGMLTDLAAEAAETTQAVAVSPEDNTSDRMQSDADHAATVDILSGLTSAVQANAAASERLALVTAEDREREKKAAGRFRTTMLAMAAASLLGFLAVVALLLYAQDSRSQLADCIKPTGHCYQDGQRRTGDAVVNLNRVTVLAAACAPDYVDLPLLQRQAAIQACITRGLK